jgi:hypothetical protein
VPYNLRGYATYVNDRRSGAWFVIVFLQGLLLCLGRPVWAESPAPTVHWGGLAFPDQTPTLSIGGTVNRFSEFDNPTRNSVAYESSLHQSFGLNFASVSWTKQWECSLCQGVTTNLTAGVGPTSEEPSKFLADIHNIFHIPRAPTGRIRHGVDGMLDASATKWFSLQKSDEARSAFGDTFIGAGLSAGTLYQEVFVRGGVRRLALPVDENLPVRFSVMGRYSRLFVGDVVRDVPNTSVIVQPVISFGPYAVNGATVPPWEIEIGVTWDSGLFVNDRGQARRERFWTASLRYHGLMFETWNDSLLNDKDRGPSFGVTLTYNLLQVWDE